MIPILLLGMVAGLGALLLLLRLDTGSATAASELAALDASRAREFRNQALAASPTAEASVRVQRLGASLWAFIERRGYRVPPGLQANLSIMERSIETHIGMTISGAVAGFIAPWLVMLPLLVVVGMSATIPLWLALLGAALGAALPTLLLNQEAEGRRRAFRHVVSAFLDLVSMNLAGGRGVPEALASAADLSDGWSMRRIRNTMETARLQGITPWAALGDLGGAMAVEELQDLAATLALVAEDGAKVRDSLAARAASMRQRELADAEAQAAKRSQSMLIAQLLLCVGFLIFLMYPALAKITG